MPFAPAYSATYNRLELDGQDAGPLRSVEGGEPFGEVVQTAGAGNVIRKRIGALHYADISIELGLIPSGPVANWISATLGRSLPRHSGAIVEFDDNYREISRLKFEHAAIHEVEFPALDAAQQEPAYLTIRLAPEQTERQTGSGVQQSKDPNLVRGATRTKPPRRCDFQLQIDGLDATRVSAVSPLVVRQVSGEAMAGEQRVYGTPALEIPDLVVTLAEAADWYAWRDTFIVGATGPERTGKLEYLSPGGKDVLAWIEFSGLGIHSLVRERSEEGAQGIRHARAAMYCGNLSYGPVVAPSPAPDAPWERLTPQSRVDVTVPLAREGVPARPEFV